MPHAELGDGLGNFPPVMSFELGFRELVIISLKD